MKVAVVILNWNGQKHLATFLPSVVQYSNNVADVIVVDNHSSDNSVSFLKTSFPLVKIVFNDENEGFAKGYNDGLEQIKGQYDLYVLLNSDVEVTPNWIEPILKLMESNPQIVACQPKIKSYLKKDYFEHAGAAGGFLDKWAYPLCRGRIFDSVEKDNGQYDHSIEVFWATGACMFIRSSVFHEVDGFDPDFFAHMEEIDLCWRMKNKGHKIYCEPQSVVYHLGGGTLSTMSPRKTYLNFRNNLLMIQKNLSFGKAFRLILLRLVLDGVAGLKFFFGFQFAHTWAVVRAHLSFYRQFFKTVKKRKSIQFKGSVGLQPYSIVIKYFLQGVSKYSEL